MTYYDKHISSRKCIFFVVVSKTLPCLMLVTLGPGAMISDLNRLCYLHYIYVLDPILQVIVTYYVL